MRASSQSLARSLLARRKHRESSNFPIPWSPNHRLLRVLYTREGRRRRRWWQPLRGGALLTTELDFPPRGSIEIQLKRFEWKASASPRCCSLITGGYAMLLLPLSPLSLTLSLTLALSSTRNPRESLRFPLLFLLCRGPMERTDYRTGVRGKNFMNFNVVGCAMPGFSTL